MVIITITSNSIAFLSDCSADTLGLFLARCCIYRGRKNAEESKSCKTHRCHYQCEGVGKAHLRPVGSFYKFYGDGQSLNNYWKSSFFLHPCINYFSASV